MPLNIWMVGGAFLVIVVVANVLARRRRIARVEETRSFAELHGFRSEGDDNPFLGVEVRQPQPKSGISLTPIMPQALFDLAAGRGTVCNVMRGSTPAGEAIVLDYCPPVAESTSGHPRFTTLAAYRVPGISEFLLVRRFGFAIGIKTIDFPLHPRFTKRFRVMANDEAVIRKLFSSSVLSAWETLGEKKEWTFQAGSGWLLASFGKAGAEDLPQLVHESARVAAALQSTT